MQYRIIAYGPERDLLTWADDTNLDATKKRLGAEGYSVFTVIREED